LRYNRVEGPHLGVHASPQIGPLRLSAGVGWSAELEDGRQWTKRAGLALHALGDDRVVLSVGAEAAPVSRYGSRHYAPFMNSVYTLFGGRDYFDYYWRERIEADVRVRLDRIPLSTNFTF